MTIHKTGSGKQARIDGGNATAKDAVLPVSTLPPPPENTVVAGAPAAQAKGDATVGAAAPSRETPTERATAQAPASMGAPIPADASKDL